MVGQQGALVYPSTTHIALDVIPLLAGGSGLILVDERAYPISLEGVNAAACRGARILRFPHNDFRALERALEDNRRFPDKVIVCDGVYPAGGYQAPLNEYSNLGRVHDAVLYVDDAHGFGLVGERPTRAMPFGTGGGGTPKHQNITGGNLVHVGGFSKAFGVPVAFVAGPRGFIDYLRDITSTYTHSSPPAIPNLAAALAVVRLNSVSGDANRRHLVEKVRLFRNRLKQYDISLTSDPFFPVQTLWFDNPSYTEVVARKLRQNGIWVVLQLWPAEHPNGAAIRFVITAQHSRADIDAAATRIAQCLLSFPSVEKGFASS